MARVKRTDIKGKPKSAARSKAKAKPGQKTTIKGKPVSGTGTKSTPKSKSKPAPNAKRPWYMPGRYAKKSKASKKGTGTKRGPYKPREPDFWKRLGHKVLWGRAGLFGSGG